MSVQLAPPLVVMSRNPPAAPTATRLRSAGLTPRLYGLERNRRTGGKPGEGTPTADPMRPQVKPPLLLRHTRAFEKWKKTRPVGSSVDGAGTMAVKNPNPTSSRPVVAPAQFWNTSG